MPAFSSVSHTNLFEIELENRNESLKESVCAGLQENNNDDERILPQYIGILLITSHLGGDLAAWGDLAGRDGLAGLCPLGPSLPARSPLAARSPTSPVGMQNSMYFGKMRSLSQ